MTINLHLPTKNETLRPTITVVGVGGAGGNAVNNMIAAELQGVHFVTANTDAQSLDNALAERRIQLGVGLTQGLGAGASPDVGRAAAEEATDDILAAIDGSHMVFITAGMGGGTGTGAAPVVARLAREQGILTVGVVTKPFQFEGTHRMKIAEHGLDELQSYVDTMIVIPNQNLFRVANERTTFADAFRMADEVLHSGVRGVTDLMVMPGLINLDFADIRAVMREMGKAMMGTGEAEGERRAVEAAEAAISNPLLDDVSMKGARGVLINITGGHDMTLFEVDEAANRIRDEVDPEANIIFGSTFHDNMEGKMRVSVVATGIEAREEGKQQPGKPSLVTQPETRSASAFHFGYNARKEPEKAARKLPAMEGASAKSPMVKEKTPIVETFSERPQKAQNTPQYTDARTEIRKEEVASVQSGFQDHYQRAEAQPGFTFAEERPQHAAPHVELRSAPSARTPAAQQTELREHGYYAADAQTESRRDPGFVAPQPNQPSHRSFYNVREENQRGFRAGEGPAPRDEQRTQERDEEESSGSSTFGFLQRMAGRAFSGGGGGNRDEQRQDAASSEHAERSEPAARHEHHEHPAREAQPAMRTEVSEREQRTSAGPTEEEYLEIPAFLRRQAN